VKRPLGTPGFSWEDNKNMSCRNMGGDVDGTQLAQDILQWRTSGFHKSKTEKLSNLMTAGFSRRALLHGLCHLVNSTSG
jgi:hypothetical protein